MLKKIKVSKEINPAIFKAYDIRGVYPEEINEESAYFIGVALVKFLNKNNLKIAIGRDGRISSPNLSKNLIKGIIDSGGNILDVGMVTTPMLYFSVAKYKLDGGINITASHNPPEYNGFKIIKEESIPISGESGLKEIQKIANSNLELPRKKGKLTKKNIFKDYFSLISKDFDFKKFKEFKIVVDTANAVQGIFLPKIFKKAKINYYHFFSKLNGYFPNHLPDPLEEKNLQVLKREVLRKKADLGISFDGDGDRIFFINEKGETISSDIIIALISSLILKENPNERIIYDIVSSKIVKETIELNNGYPIMSKVGHSFIKELMRKKDVIFAGEFSGHYYCRDQYFSDSPFFVFFKILEELFETKKKISELIQPFKKYFHSGQINFKTKNKEYILVKLKEKYKIGEVSTLDGLRIDFNDWWFVIRPSNTEPLLRLIVEGKTKDILDRKVREISSIINEAPFFA